MPNSLFRNRCFCSMLPSATQMAQTCGWLKQPLNQDRDFFASWGNRAPALFISKAEGKNTRLVFTRAQLLDRSWSCISNLHFLCKTGEQSLNCASLSNYKIFSYGSLRIFILWWCITKLNSCAFIRVVRNNSVKDFKPQVRKKITFKVFFFYLYEEKLLHPSATILV